MRKDKTVGGVDLHAGVIAESKLITLKHLEFSRQLNKAAIATIQEKRPISKCESYDIRRKDIVTKHVSLNRTNAAEASGVE
jgi:hypothetical protein